MKFRLWLENTAEIDQISDHLLKSVDYLIDGQWTLERDKRLLPTWRHQKYQKITLQGKNVIQNGDVYEITITMYLYKKPRSEFDFNRYDIPYPYIPDWANDPEQWNKTTHYDPKEGHPTLEFHVLVTKDNIKIADSDSTGNRFKTPFQIAQFAKNAIENPGWDNGDNDDLEPDFDPSPATPQLVGV